MQDNTTLLIGGGYSNTALLQQTVDHLIKSGAPLEGATIVMCDARKENIAGGIAFAASDPVFQMGDVIRGLFAPYRQWLVENRERWVKWYEEVGGEDAKKWVRDHSEQLKPENFESHSLTSPPRTMYFPRVVFGLYLKDVLKETMDKAHAHGINVELYESKVLDVDHEPDGKFHCAMDVEHASRVQMLPDAHGGYEFKSVPSQVPVFVDADNVVLATGIPAGKGFPEAEKSPSYFASPYETKNDGQTQLGRIKKVIRAHFEATHKPVEVVLVGAGYRSQDMALGLVQDSEMLPMIHVTGVEAVKKSWEPWTDPELASAQGPYTPKHFTKDACRQLRAEAAPDGSDAAELKKKVNELVQQEVDAAKAQNVSLATVRKLVVENMKHLPDSLHQYATEFVRRIPATNVEMALAIRVLEKEGKFKLIEDMVGNIRPREDGGLEVVRPDGSAIINADVAINCMGPPSRITDNKAPFIQKLLQKEIIKPNPKGRGVLTTLDRQSPDVPGFYTIGPLLMDNEYPEAKAVHARHHDIGVLHSCYYDAEAASGSLASRITGQQVGQQIGQASPDALGEWTATEKKNGLEASLTSTLIR